MDWIKQNCNYKFVFSYVDLRKICEKVWRNFMCFRATMNEPKDTSDVKIRNIMKELSSVFTDTIEQVNVSYRIDIVCI